MDSKILLAILIVALIGIVAATYNNEATDAIQTLTSVATEEDSQDSATDILDSDISSPSQDSSKIDEDVVKPDNGDTKKGTDNKVSNAKTPSNSNNGNSNQNTKPTNTTNTLNPNTNNSNNQQTNPNVKISSTRAKEIATNNLPKNYTNAVASTPKLYDRYYEVTFFADGKAIGYYEIDAYTGAITGGAFENEVPDLIN